jgi:hypothetical protein
MGFPLISNLWHWQDSFVQQNASFSEYENFATEPFLWLRCGQHT